MITEHTEKLWESFKKGAHIAIMAGCACGAVGLLYAHRRVIGAWIKGEELPQLPEGHPCVGFRHCQSKCAESGDSACEEE